MNPSECTTTVQDACFGVVLFTLEKGLHEPDRVKSFASQLASILIMAREGLPLDAIEDPSMQRSLRRDAIEDRAEFLHMVTLPCIDAMRRECEAWDRTHCVAGSESVCTNTDNRGIEHKPTVYGVYKTLMADGATRDPAFWARVPCPIRLAFDIRGLPLSAMASVRLFFQEFSKRDIPALVTPVVDRTLIVASKHQMVMWKIIRQFFKASRPLQCVSEKELNQTATMKWFGVDVHPHIQEKSTLST